MVLEWDFVKNINCTENLHRFEHQNETWFIAFYTGADICQVYLFLMGLVLNIISYNALGLDDSESELVMQLRSLAVSDSLYLLFNTLDNLCHTLESMPALNVQFFWYTIYVHPPAWGLRVTLITIHNWIMLFLSVSRFARIRWPLKGSQMFNKSRTRKILFMIWFTGGATSLIRSVEVTSILAEDCEDGVIRMAIVGSRIFPLYTSTFNYVFQTGLPVLISIFSNVMLIYTIKTRASIGSSDEGRSSKDSQVTRMVLMLMNLYIFCQLPMCFWGFVILFPIPVSLYISLTLGGNVISSLDASCNFFIYVATNPKFKRNVNKFLGWKNPARDASTASRTSKYEE